MPNTTQTLPSATQDWDRMRSDLYQFGYCLMSNALALDEAERVKARLLDQAAGEVKAGLALRDGGGPDEDPALETAPNQRVTNLLDKGEEFWQLLLHPIVDEVVCPLLGKHVISSSVTANITHPGGQPQPLHTDQAYVDVPVSKAVVCNTLWMLSDFTADNGGTWLVPGSHHWNRMPSDPYDFSDVIALEGEVGTVCVFEGRIWHGTGANVTEGDSRVGLLNYWCRPWIRQQENMPLSLRDETVAAMPEKLKQRLGFAVHGTLGNVDPALRKGALGDLVDRSVPRVGRLSLLH